MVKSITKVMGFSYTLYVFTVTLLVKAKLCPVKSPQHFLRHLWCRNPTVDPMIEGHAVLSRCFKQCVAPLSIVRLAIHRI